jgi:1-acyl-sn-glycerol-3-phosphate acyltransferase
MNVAIDLVVGCILFFLPSKIFYRLSTQLINYTTPIVYGIPMVLSGTKMFVDQVDIMQASKSTNSLLLSSHSSRIDWMVAMFIGNLTNIGEQPSRKCRVGFVCEALIQFMPFVGWYRKLICHDIFVWRSFDKDEHTIKTNIADFHEVSEQRMLFLSPEGVIVDYGEKDTNYINECRQFAIKNGFKPLDYVLTPRYKGTSCLLQQVVSGGPIVSICLAFVRDGRLLNCKLLSEDRVVPDIYDLTQGIAGAPVDIFIHLRRISVDPASSFNAKAVLMDDYIWKDSVLAAWEARLSNGELDGKWMAQYTPIKGCKRDILINHLAHAFFMIGMAVTFGSISFLLKTFAWIFAVISVSHTIGWYANMASMESVPFETGIKAAILCFQATKIKCSTKKRA